MIVPDKLEAERLDFEPALFRHRVLGMLRRKGLLTPERIRLMRSWAHSGFNVNAQVRVGADDATGRENLARHRPNLDFGLGQRDNPTESQAITTPGGLAAGSFDTRRGRKFLWAHPDGDLHPSRRSQSRLRRPL